MMTIPTARGIALFLVLSLVALAGCLRAGVDSHGSRDGSPPGDGLIEFEDSGLTTADSTSDSASDSAADSEIELDSTSDSTADSSFPDTTSSGPHLMIYSNYDGGTFTINVDTALSPIVIGIVSYEACNVTIQGPEIDRIAAVHYAGYNDSPGSQITGIDPSKVTILKAPPATLTDPNGWPTMVCAYQGGSKPSGGCNTGDQVEHYFLTHFGGALEFHRCQYNVYSGVLNTSDGGSCL